MYIPLQLFVKDLFNQLVETYLRTGKVVLGTMRLPIYCEYYEIICSLLTSN